MKRNCLKCERPIANAINGDLEHTFDDPPGDASCWTSVGNYGSIYDSQFENHRSGKDSGLEITICDACLTQASRLGLVNIYTRYKEEHVTLKSWKPS